MYTHCLYYKHINMHMLTSLSLSLSLSLQRNLHDVAHNIRLVLVNWACV